MSQTAVIRLVKSLSQSEKRNFKLYAKRHAGNKDYLDLFGLIEKNGSPNKENLEKEFGKLRGTRSFDNTARYLFKILTDCLIQAKIKEDEMFQVTHGLLRINILKERNLPEEAFRELKKLQQTAIVHREQFLQYMINRHELNYLTEINFLGISEKQLIDIQMKTRDVLKEIRNTHEHNSLFEILKHRLVHSGKTIAENRKQLNDLMLSELSIINAKSKHNLESRKLHLLFQSYFFTNIGDYNSALKTFYELNRLFEKNNEYWRNPPQDYLSSLDGTLDSLRTIDAFDEMPFYIARLEQLDKEMYPEYFRFMVRKTIMIYHLIFLVNSKQYDKAIDYISQCDTMIIKSYSIVDEEKQNELLFCLALSFFKIRNFKKAQKCINEIVLLGKLSYQSLVYRASRLLSIIIHYEQNNLEYLEYEMRSFKRAFQHNAKLLKVETLLFKTIKMHPRKNMFQKNELFWSKIEPLVIRIEKDKYETQLSKHFDFTGWIKNKFNKQVS